MAVDGAEEREDEHERSDLAVMGVEEYKQKRRTESLLDSLELFRMQYDKALDELVTGEIGLDGFNITVQTAVKHAIQNSRNKLREHARNNDWDDRYWVGDADNPIAVMEFDTRDDLVIQGLRDYYNTDWYYTETWTETVERPQMGPKTKTVPTDKTVPDEVSTKAFDRLVEFLGQEQGMDVQTEVNERDEHADPW